jgi:hypothetical protein
VQLGASIELDIYVAYAFIFESAISSARILAHWEAAGANQPIPRADLHAVYLRKNK